jgi:hypothetical protein
MAKTVKSEQEKTAAAEARAQKFEKRVLDGALQAAAITAGVHKHALDDVLARGTTLFKLDANGNPVQLGEDGKPVFGKDGKTLYSPDEWLGGMKENAPHWFPNGNTGSPNGEGGGGGNGKTIKQSELDAKSPKERAEFFANTPDAKVVD